MPKESIHYSVSFLVLGRCKILCSYERVGWLGSLDLSFSIRDLAKRAENFAIRTLQPGYINWKPRGWTLVDQIAASCISCCIFHIVSIPFNCSDAAIKVFQSYDRCESEDFCVWPCLLSFSHFAPELLARIFGLFSSRKQRWNFQSYEPTWGEIGPGNRASPATRTHVKRPLLSFQLIGPGRRTHILSLKQ